MGGFSLWTVEPWAFPSPFSLPNAFLLISSSSQPSSSAPSVPSARQEEQQSPGGYEAREVSK